MTPARKKKLRVSFDNKRPLYLVLDYVKLKNFNFFLKTLLRKKAAEELKREQERKAEERRKIIRERTGQPRNIEDANEGKFFKNQIKF